MKIESIKKAGFGVSVIAFPVMLQVGFVDSEKLFKTLNANNHVDNYWNPFHQGFHFRKG